MPPPEPAATTDPAADPAAALDPGLGSLRVLRPLTNQLIADALAAENWSYDFDQDGDPYGFWDGVPVCFQAIKGSAIQITTVLRIETPGELTELYEFCNEWNQVRLWPKAYVRVDNDSNTGDADTPDGDAGGGVAVCGEVNAHLPDGATLEQVRQLVRCGVATSYQLATSLSERDN